MTNQRAIILLSQMYLPAFDEEEKQAIDKAIEALTAQEPQEPKYPIRKQSKHGWFFYCPKCEIVLNDMSRPQYCSECGQAVKWE